MAIVYLTVSKQECFKNGALSQWHACEHKLVHALESDLLLSLDTLKKIPKFHPRDGTREFYLALMILPSLICFCLFPCNWTLGVFVIIVLSCICQLLSNRCKWLNFLDWTFYLTWLTQKFTTAEPTDEQLQETIKLGNEIRDYFYASALTRLIKDLKNLTNIFTPDLYNN